jgi:hypothetical protein
MIENATWARAAIVIRAPEIGVDEVARRIGAPPRHRGGERKMRERGIWYFHSGLDTSHGPREHILVLVDFIRSHMKPLKELARSYPAELSCTFASSAGEGSFMIQADELAVLAEAGFSLFLSLYPPGNNEKPNESDATGG